jgi:hypothetical protein
MLNKSYVYNIFHLKHYGDIMTRNFFILLFLCWGASSSYAQINSASPVSTNPAKAMVEELKLPNYDTYLDSIDYNAPEKIYPVNVRIRDIKWHWMSDVEYAKKHIEAYKKLLECGAQLPKIDNSSDMSEIRPVVRLSFKWEYDEDEFNKLITKSDMVNDQTLMDVLPYIPEIEYIDLPFTKITDKGVVSFFYLPLLKSVSLTTTEPKDYPSLITDEGIEIITKLPLLESISLRNLLVTEKSFRSIAENGKRIKDVSLEGDCISDSGISYLRKMQSLESLSISQCSRGDLNNTHSSALVTPNVFAALSQSPNLSSIRFTLYDFSSIPNDTVITAIKSMNKLYYLDFRHTKIHPLLLKNICEIKTLRELCIDGGYFKFDSNSQISYEKVMYRLRHTNQLPAYYEELEKPYFDEFYSRHWISGNGKYTRDASFIDLKEGQVALKSKGSETIITVPIEKLSQDDQQYIQQIISEPKK